MIIHLRGYYEKTICGIPMTPLAERVEGMAGTFYTHWATVFGDEFFSVNCPTCKKHFDQTLDRVTAPEPLRRRPRLDNPL